MHDWLLPDTLPAARALRDRLAAAEDVSRRGDTAADRAPRVRAAFQAAGVSLSACALALTYDLVATVAPAWRGDAREWVRLGGVVCFLGAVAMTCVAVVRRLTPVTAATVLVVERDNGSPFFFRPKGCWVRCEVSADARRWARLPRTDFERAVPGTVAVMHRHAGEVVRWTVVGCHAPDPPAGPNLDG